MTLNTFLPTMIIPATILAFTIILLLIRYLIKQKINTPVLMVGVSQEIGDREEQEDSFSIIEDESGFLAVLADGMGGFSSGKKASESAVKTFMEEFTRNYYKNSINHFLINTTHISNYNLIKSAKGENMGTTMVAVYIREGFLYWVSVGDSQIYLYRNNGLHKINPRHTFALKLREACRKGEISREAARTHPQRDRLISYLGDKDFHLLDYSDTPIKLNKGDRVLLCSDGVYNSLSEFEIEEILSKKRISAKERAEAIMERVLYKNISNQDNATILVVEKVK